MSGDPDGREDAAKRHALPAGSDRFTRLVADEVARLRAARDLAPNLDGPAHIDGHDHAFVPGSIHLARIPEGAPSLECRTEYRVGEFLAYQDEEFVRNAYRGILGREPDAQGLSDYLAALRSGKFVKVEILGRLRFSREGRRAKVTVRKLVLPFAMRTVRHVPVLGRIIGIAQYLIRLPEIARTHEKFEAAYFHRETEVRRQLNTALGEIEISLRQTALSTMSAASATRSRFDAVELVLNRESAARSAFEHTSEAMAKTVAEKLALLDSAKAGRSDVERLRQRSEEVAEAVAEKLALLDSAKAGRSDVERLRQRSEEVAERARADADHAKADIARRATELDEAIVRLARQVAALASAKGEEPADAFYSAFENKFRGGREEIRQRMTVYLPLMQQLSPESAALPVLDLGCGRGEWLELLRESGILARGIDVNCVFAVECRARGLEVQDGDALLMLREMQAESVRAITGMHIIEHLPFARLIQLVDEAFRVLIPGGVVVFETPNPENILVGACNFYIDPTHERPLPPEPMRFLLESRGFADVEILRLHPMPDSVHIADGPPALRSRLNELLFGPQDYAVVGRKARS